MKSTKPIQVTIAGRLMWSLFIFGTLYAMFMVGVAIAQSVPGVIGLAIIYALVIVLLGLLVRTVLVGRNWARVTYAVLACISITAILVSRFMAPASTIVSYIVSISLVSIYSVILFLLFHSNAKPWFRGRDEEST